MRRKQSSAAIVLMLIPALALACPKGSYEYKGDCEYDIMPETAKPVQPSDELPPKDKMPSWQREDTHVVSVPMGVEPGTDTAHDFAAESNGK